ncbi:MAG: helix-turn-helix domain-containing protein [Hyphomicrobium sp.]|uniref:helix-turn-helix domain-containing protein n=1 Tax=Hyphomicrobium sp. TaxID=82 RepID=UPI0022CB54BB|nr:helix-turn-helix domain-containing protein [Hyphomicrobium sp.]MBZ0211630.1 helix-turn-helix domain-containing protein [Hyphomicrobium sp.]MCZ7595018.1 helix-turn-helix domain-containing protein [Hyphomicrobium sp.]
MEYELAEIRAHALFKDLGDQSLQRVLSNAVMSLFPRHSTLVTEGQRCDLLYMLFEGTATSTSVHRGRATTLFLLKPGAAFPLSSIVRNEVPLSTIVTQGPCRILMLPAEGVRALLSADNAFCLAVLNAMARTSRDKTREIKNLKLRSSAERLANWIHEMHRKTPKRRRLDLPMDKKTLALRLGMTPENLARGFAHLRAYGVRVEGRTIWIEDPGALARYADPSPLIDESQA